MKYARFTTFSTIFVILTFPFSICACEKQQAVELLERPTHSISSANNVAASSTTTKVNKAETASDLAREEIIGLSEKTEVMDYFFKTFFSANFEAALKITSIRFRTGKTREQIETKWKRFFDESKKRNLNLKNLAYRTNPFNNTGNTGAVISPSGRIVMAIDFTKYQTSSWQVNDVRFFYKALNIQSSNSLVFTGKTDNPTYKDIRDVVVTKFANPAGLKESEFSINSIVVCDGWARVVTNIPSHGLKPPGLTQIILRTSAGKWLIVTQGINISGFDFPESPYKVWVSGS